MVAVHMIKRPVQETDDVLQVVIGQVAARQNQVNVAHALTDVWAVKHGFHLVADS